MIDGFHQVQEDSNNLLLSECLARVRQGVSHGETGVKGSWRKNLFGDVRRQGYGYGWDAEIFNGTLDQSHGLIADASGGGEDYDVYLIVLEHGCDLWCGFMNKGVDVGTYDMTHK